MFEPNPSLAGAVRLTLVVLTNISKLSYQNVLENTLLKCLISLGLIRIYGSNFCDDDYSGDFVEIRHKRVLLQAIQQSGRRVQRSLYGLFYSFENKPAVTRTLAISIEGN